MKIVIVTLVLVLTFVFAVMASADTPLSSGLNLVAGTGELPSQYIASHQCATAIWGWNSQLQEWTHYYVGVPNYVNEYRPVGQMLEQNGYVVLCQP